MSNVVERLADMTALRDRQSLDVALVQTLNDLLQPQAVLIARWVGHRDQARWLTCAYIEDGVPQPTSTETWADLEDLPQASDFPMRQQVLSQQKAQLADKSGGLNCFALIASTGAKAVLEIRTRRALSTTQLHLIDGVLRLYQNFQNLLDYGERDALTDLLNRKTFDGAFLKATLVRNPAALASGSNQRDADTRPSTVNRRTERYWLAMIDIDHFKRVNDQFGHLIGDEVLLLLARVMRSTFRFDDQLYRFGGEEFVILMRCDTCSQADTGLQRLRSATENYRFPQVGTITISVGFTEIRPGDAPTTAIERADKAVYFAKEHGRNQVCSYETLLESGRLAAPIGNVGDVELF